MKKSILYILLTMFVNFCNGQYSSIDTTYYPNGQIHQIIMKLEGDSITIIKRYYSQYLKFENRVFLLSKKKEDKIEAIETYINWGNDGLMQEGFRKDVLNSITTIKEQVAKENKGFKTQIIFLEYDYEPYAYFCGFGEGDYPILDTPKYFKFNFKEELFNGVGRISYADFWSKKIELDERLEESDLADLIWDSEIYQGLQDAYKFKTNLLLFEAFEGIPIEAFEGIPVKLPLLIYGNEHDCEVMNVYIYE